MERQHGRQSASRGRWRPGRRSPPFARALGDFSALVSTATSRRLNTAVSRNRATRPDPPRRRPARAPYILGDSRCRRRRAVSSKGGWRATRSATRGCAPACRPDWAIADKTGTGDHGEARRAAILRPSGAPAAVRRRLFRRVGTARPDSSATPAIATRRGVIVETMWRGGARQGEFWHAIGIGLRRGLARPGHPRRAVALTPVVCASVAAWMAGTSLAMTRQRGSRSVPSGPRLAHPRAPGT